MKIHFSTTIDQYKGKFPTNYSSEYTGVPQIGGMVCVTTGYISVFHNKGLPSLLEVTSIEYGNDSIIVHLYYSKTQLKSFHLNPDIKPFA